MYEPILPAPPTDNLYKFVALAGLVLFIGAPVFWIQYTLELRQGEDDHVRANLTALGVFLEAHDAASYFRPAGIPTPTPVPEALANEKKVQAAVETASARLGQYAPYAAWVTATATVAAILGLALAILGFRLWYVRVQRPQDLLLMRQLDQHPQPTA